MRLVTHNPDLEAGYPSSLQWPFNFRLYDDNGEPMKWVKSVSFKVDPSAEHTVIMVIERYVMKDDEIDITVPEEWVEMHSIPAPEFPPPDPADLD